MNEIKTGKEKLQKALLEVSKEYLENIELAPEDSVSFSPKLEKNMEQLLQSRQKPCWKLINSPLKKVIAVCLAVVILIGSVLGCVMAKEPIFEFFTEVYEKFTEFFFEDENEGASDVITEVHTLTYVPEGYELVESPTLTGDNNELYTVWENNDGEKIIFYQSAFVTKTTIDSENAQKGILSNGLQIVMIQKDKVIYIYWNDNQYAYTLIVQDMNEKQIIEILDSFA
ncbi:MAG: DUF4367 domain-containing protein [Clostridia bacterium]|nr:DUF4367 domain-containing protein [Clostridia bacterium]